MVKRVVDTKFWTDMQVIDNYSVEDKYFYLYLMTNAKTTQVGIYPLPIKVISFETGYTVEAIRVLLDRFSSKYKQIIYSEKTQEVSLLESLKTTILKGGKPVSDLLTRELRTIKDGSLIEATYEAMNDFWELSTRKFDKTIKELFEAELTNRGMFNIQNDNQKENEIQNDIQINNENEKQNYNEIQNDIYNENDNHNHNEESWATIRENVDEMERVDRYIDYLRKLKPDLPQDIDLDNILNICYEVLYGEVHPHIENQLRNWQSKLPTTLILEALVRSVKANKPLLYANSIIKNWEKQGVSCIDGVRKLDNEYNK